jgi:hypothetical protein
MSFQIGYFNLFVSFYKKKLFQTQQVKLTM